MLTAACDEDSGIVITKSSGMTSPEEMKAYVDEIRLLRHRERKRTGQFLHLVDLRESSVQSQASTEKLSSLVQADTGRSANDKTAIVANSSLMKLQVARMTPQPPYQTFADYDEAVEWLKAHDD